MAQTNSTPAVRHLDMKFDNDTPEKSALEIAHAFNPTWKDTEGEVEVIQFTDGITNALCKVTKKTPGNTESQNDDDSVLVRSYGKGTELIIDRKREMRAHNLLSSKGLAPALLAHFENGLVYRFVQGHVCSPEDLRRPEVYRQTAKTLGQWHAILPIGALQAADGKNSGLNGDKQTPPKPNLWDTTQQWLEILPETNDKERERKKLLKAELADLSARLIDAPGLDGKDYVFSHPDLLHGNVIVQVPTGTPVDFSKQNPVTFIDYEYSQPGPAAFDLANHFAEWSGFPNFEYDKVPNKSQRLDFIRHYLGSYRYHAISDDETTALEVDLKAEVEQLFEQVDAFRGLPGLFWGVWALIQSMISTIDFDFADYAENRLGEYWDWKGEDSGSREREGKEKPLRERRWAEE